MIDIHTHILPGVDDGSPSLDVSLQMLRIASENGTTDIVATPHSNLEFAYDEKRIRDLYQDLAAKMTGTITIHLGCDFHLSVDNVHDALAHPTKYTINGRGYLMVELPDLTSLVAMRNVLNRMLESRITPVVTHPERNPTVQSQIKEIEAWVRDGCLMQITGQSLTGRFGARAQKFSEALLNADLVHFVASDAHDPLDRPPNLMPAYKLVSQRWGTEKADDLFVHNPAAALIGEPIYAVPAPKKSFFSSLLRR